MGPETDKPMKAETLERIKERWSGTPPSTGVVLADSYVKAAYDTVKDLIRSAQIQRDEIQKLRAGLAHVRQGINDAWDELMANRCMDAELTLAAVLANYPIGSADCLHCHELTKGGDR